MNEICKPRFTECQRVICRTKNFGAEPGAIEEVRAGYANHYLVKLDNGTRTLLHEDSLEPEMVMRHLRWFGKKSGTSTYVVFVVRIGGIIEIWKAGASEPEIIYDERWFDDVGMVEITAEEARERMERWVYQQAYFWNEGRGANISDLAIRGRL